VLFENKKGEVIKTLGDGTSRENGIISYGSTEPAPITKEMGRSRQRERIGCPEASYFTREMTSSGPGGSGEKKGRQSEEKKKSRRKGGCVELHLLRRDKASKRRGRMGQALSNLRRHNSKT